MLEELGSDVTNEVVVLVVVTVIQLYVDAKPVKLLVVLFEARLPAIVLVATLVSEVRAVLFVVALRLADVDAFE